MPALEDETPPPSRVDGTEQDDKGGVITAYKMHPILNVLVTSECSMEHARSPVPQWPGQIEAAKGRFRSRI